MTPGVGFVQIGSDKLSATILARGVALQDVRLTGVPHGLTLGSPDISSYDTEMQFSGTIMGPVANRIAGACAEIDGTRYCFDANLATQHTLHGGSGATHAKIWQLADHTDTSALFHLTLPNGEAGFPATRNLTAQYSITETTLRLTLTATTTKPTLINLANHSYWNLGPNPTTKGHSLTVHADQYLPSDEMYFLPTGKIAEVTNTRFDYRTPREIMAGAEGLIDNNFCLSATRQPLRHVATLKGPTGITMRMATTEPGLQVYDGHTLGIGNFADMDGQNIQPYAGLALEAQFWPDATNNPDFPDITLRPGDPWQQITEWTFSAG